MVIFVLASVWGGVAQAKTISYDALVAAMDDGTYATQFSVGNMFSLDLGTEGKLHAEIVAFDADEKADGSGKAKVSVITKELLNNKHSMNSTNTTTDGWPATAMRSYLNETIMPKIPSAVSERIVEVTKTYKDYEKGEQTSNDSLWIPSARELSDNNTCETTGPAYTFIFKNANTRQKHTANSANYSRWWTRTSNNNTTFREVSDQGVISYHNPSLNRGVALGFCLD